MENELYIRRLTKEDCIEFKNIVREKLHMVDNGKVERYNDHLLIKFLLPGTDVYMNIYFYDYLSFGLGLYGYVDGKDVGAVLYDEWVKFLTKKYPNEYEIDLKNNAITF